MTQIASDEKCLSAMRQIASDEKCVALQWPPGGRMGLWLAAAAWASEPTAGLDPRVRTYLESALYVVDAYVVRTVTFDLMGIHWTGDRRPPGTTRQIRYCVAYDRPPVGVGENTSVVSEEWVVVDGAGVALTVDRFASLTGLPPRKSRGRGVMLGGAQLGFTRREAESAAADRSLAAAEGIPARARDTLRRQVVSSLHTGCSEGPPAPIGEP